MGGKWTRETVKKGKKKKEEKKGRGRKKGGKKKKKKWKGEKLENIGKNND